MAKPKYRGKLARPITPGLVELVQHGDFESWAKSDRVKRETLSRMTDLLEHHQIDPSSPNCWFILAFELASDHVPGFHTKRFHRRPGRPRKKSSTTAQTEAKKRGRPKKYPDDYYAALANSVDKRKKELESKRKRRVSDKDVLTDLLTELAKKRGKSAVRFVDKELSHFQKRLPEARQRIRKKPK